MLMKRTILLASALAAGLLALPSWAGVDKPEQMNDALMAGFNGGDMEALRKLYHPDAIFVSVPGTTVSGIDAILAELAKFMAPGVPLQLTTRHVYITGDTAEIISDWVIQGKAKDGTDMNATGTAVDLLRKGEDGKWYFYIDNPYGTAKQ
jgi:uncharacterized protein (TIGR02246 family)